jgi:hypothetical protein
VSTSASRQRSGAALGVAACLSALLLFAPERGRSDALSPLEPEAIVSTRDLAYAWSHGIGWSLLPEPETKPRFVVHASAGERWSAIVASGVARLVVWIPHAAGTIEGSEVVARIAADRGWSVVALVPAASLPPPGASLDEWLSLLEARERAARAAVRHYTTAFEPRCTLVMGVSLGGTAALAVSHLEGGVHLAAAMLPVGTEAGFASAAAVYSAARAQALSPAEHERIAAVDPAARAHGLGAEHILLVRAAWDEVMPDGAFTALRDALGRPDEHTYPTGHESFRYALPLAAARALAWADQHCP